jgi:four helix bundle protein
MSAVGAPGKHITILGVNMTEQDMKDRTKEFGLRAIRLVDALPRTSIGWTIGEQLMKSATSVGANYRAACRGRSKADFIAKLGIAEEEADESCYWLELIADAHLMQRAMIVSLLQEGNELTAIIAASRATARRNAE